MVEEVLALLVQATVFKIVGSHGNHVIGGFDSHALPPLPVSHFFYHWPSSLSIEFGAS